VAGAAINCYYHRAFANVVLSYDLSEVKPFELYEWTKRYTVEDGALAGAGLGLAASVPTLFMRKPAIPPWTRCVGMTNIGACAGILGAHGYFQYTGERQQAYRTFDMRMKRRSLSFWRMNRDKEFMASLDPVMQYYVRHNGVWYTQLLPEKVFEQPEEYVQRTVKGKKTISNTSAPTVEQSNTTNHFPTATDYAKELSHIDVAKTLAAIAKLESEKEDLLREAEYLLSVNAQQQYEYCRADAMDDDERQRRLREIELVAMAYDRFRNSAHSIDVKLVHWCLALQHKAALTSFAVADDQVAHWTPKSEMIDFSTHKPSTSIQEIEHLRAMAAADVKKFEECAAYAGAGISRAEREQCRRDAVDGRVVMRATEHVIFRLEKARVALEESAVATAEDADEQKPEEGASVSAEAVEFLPHHLQTATNVMRSQTEAVNNEEKQEKSQVEEEKPVKPPI
jgi:hypothetical protein